MTELIRPYINYVLKYIWYIFLLVFSVLSSALNGCTPNVTTTYSSMKDPFYGSIIYNRIMVMCYPGNNEFSKNFEEAVCRELNTNGVFAISQFNVLPPIREYTAAEKRFIIDKYRLDGLLLMSPNGMDQITIKTPIVSSSETNIYSQRNSLDANTNSITYGGDTRTIPRGVKFSTKLYDIRSEKNLWSCDLYASFKIGATELDNEVMDNISAKVAEALIVDKIVKFSK